MNDIVKAARDAGEQFGAEAVKNIPYEHGIKLIVRILQRVLQEMLGNLLGRKRLVEIAGRSAAFLFFFGAAEFLP